MISVFELFFKLLVLSPQDKLDSLPFCKTGDENPGGNGDNLLRDAIHSVTKGVGDYKINCKGALGYLSVYRYCFFRIALWKFLLSSALQNDL